MSLPDKIPQDFLKDVIQANRQTIGELSEQGSQLTLRLQLLKRGYVRPWRREDHARKVVLLLRKQDLNGQSVDCLRSINSLCLRLLVEFDCDREEDTVQEIMQRLQRATAEYRQLMAETSEAYSSPPEDG